MESQLELRAFRDCLDKWEVTISKIRSEIYALKAFPKDEIKLRGIASQLGKICLEADAWGFDNLHHLALRTQQVVFDIRLGNLPWDNQTVEYLQDGLAMLSSILPQCEKEFLQRQSTSNMLRFLFPDREEIRAEGDKSLPE